MRSLGDKPILVRKIVNLPNFAYILLNGKLHKSFGKIMYEMRNRISVLHVKNILTWKFSRNVDFFLSSRKHFRTIQIYKRKFQKCQITESLGGCHIPPLATPLLEMYFNVFLFYCFWNLKRIERRVSFGFCLFPLISS